MNIFYGQEEVQMITRLGNVLLKICWKKIIHTIAGRKKYICTIAVEKTGHTYNSWEKIVHTYNSREKIVHTYNSWEKIVHTYNSWEKIVHIYNSWEKIVHTYNSWEKFFLSLTQSWILPFLVAARWDSSETELSVFVACPTKRARFFFRWVRVQGRSPHAPGIF